MENKHSVIRVLILFLGLMACSPAKQSEVKIVQGTPEVGFPYVVPIMMDGRAFCTGTFVSDSVLITAAHCVEHAKTVEWKGTGLRSSRISIHSSWPTEGEACQLVAKDPKYDVALVRFAKGTFKGEAAPILTRRLLRGETFRIVGYGNNQIVPFDQYCQLPPQVSADGLCHVYLGVRKESGDYDYTSVRAFAPGSESDGIGCPVDCPMSGLKSALAAESVTLKDFVNQTCDGNFRDRSYAERGFGIKRSGTNRIAALVDGVIAFDGAVNGNDSGTGVTSGSGDSGGPLFIHEDGRDYLAGLTHGGRLKVENGQLQKRSIYNDLTADTSRDWLLKIVAEQQLDVPSLVEPGL